MGGLEWDGGLFSLDWHYRVLQIRINITVTLEKTEEAKKSGGYDRSW